MANDESEEDNDVTNCVTPQVSTKYVVPSKPQHGLSRTLNFKRHGWFLIFP